jgi:hypothetical protein
VTIAVPSGRETSLNRQPLFVLTLLLLLTACGGGGDVDTGSGATSHSTGTTTDSDTTTPSDEPAAFVPWGPNDPPIPGQYAALAVTSGGELDCDSVDQQAPDNDFWTTVLGVCRALRGDAAWPASRSLDPPPAENGYQDCLNRELATTLDALFAWREEHPGAEPNVTYPTASARSRCTFRVYDPSAFPVSPDSSAPSGGVVVELYVAGLDEDASPPVLVDGEPVELTEDFSGGDDGLLIGELFIPGPIEAHTATIVVQADFGDVKGSVALPDIPVNTSSSPPTGPTTTTT